MPTDNKTKLHLIVGALLIISFAILFVRQEFFSMSQEQLQPARIGQADIVVEIVVNDAAKARGLSNRLELPVNQGMYFPYTDRRARTFHMGNMLFPVDMVWLSQGSIVAISQNVQLFDAAGNVTRVLSPAPVDGVLELNAGFVQAHQVKVGDEFKILDK
ncbi:DUF192 domain-containing protein [Candidatus Falkowbacteria bacterium]|nr:DUF192 domain-containing protein [Candidatus Falkowbacteria bacterium]